MTELCNTSVYMISIVLQVPFCDGERDDPLGHDRANFLAKHTTQRAPQSGQKSISDTIKNKLQGLWKLHYCYANIILCMIAAYIYIYMFDLISN